MTSVAERVPLDRISRRAHAARPGRAVLVTVTAVLFGLGWAAYKMLAVAWLALAWAGAATAEGWTAAREDARRKSRQRGVPR